MKRLTLTAVGVVLFCTAGHATPGSGYLFNLILNRATTTGALHTVGGAHGWFVSLHTTRRSDVVVQDVALAPGGFSGWHSHPGPVLITVKTGTATWYQASHERCDQIVYPRGSAFVEPAGVVHTVQNEGADDLELIDTYIVPVGVRTRTEENDPGVCPGVR